MKKIKCCEKSYIFSKIFAIISICLCFSLIFTNCGGGGGGAGGASIPASEYTTHNAGGWGGSGNSGGANGGSGGNGVNTTGGTPLVIDHYFYNQNYASTEINNLIAVIQNDGSITNTVITVDFYVAGESTPRQARVTKGNTKVEKFEHQYKATCTNTQTSSTFTRYFYHDSGLDLSAETTTPNMQWQCAQNGVTYGNFINGIQGDITLSTVFGTPNCDINLTSPSPNASNIYEISNLTDSFTFGIAMNGGGDFPDGTTFAWQVPGNTPFSGTSGTITKTIAEYGLSENSLGTNTSNASDLIILCTVSIPGEPQFIKSKTIKVFKKVTLPTNFSVSLDSKPSTAGTNSPYKIYNASSTTDYFTFTASRTGGFPLNTEFHWKVNGNDVSGTGQTVNISPSQMGTIGTSSTQIHVECEIDHADKIGSTQTKDTSIYVYQVTISAFEIDPSGLPNTHPKTGGAYHLGPDDMTKTFTLTVDDTNIPDGAVYTWEVVGGAQLASGTDKHQITPTIKAMRNNNENVPTSTETLTIKCTVSHPNLPASYSQEDTATVKFTEPLTLADTTALGITSACGYQNSDGYYSALPAHWNSGYTFEVNESLPSDTSYSWSATFAPGRGKNGSDPTFTISVKEFVSGEDTPYDGAANCTCTIYCTLSAPGYQDRIVEIPIRVDYTPNMGFLASPNAVGNIVFSDGSATPYTNFDASNPMKEWQKAAAVAVIFASAGDGEWFGVGLNESTLSWADASNYCTSYGVAVNGYTGGWNLYSIEIIETLIQAKNTVNAAFSKIGTGATSISADDWYWSSSQSEPASWAYHYVEGRNSWNTSDEYKVRAIRRF